MERDVSGGSGNSAHSDRCGSPWRVIALVASSLGQFLCLLLQQFIQRFFYAAPD